MGDEMMHHQREPSREGASSILGLTMLQEPVVEEKAPDRVAWEYHSVSLSRVPGYGFGIAVSGGRDNPHFANGDPAIAISDVLKGGPAELKLLVNDRILSANGVSLENVDYATAVQVLRDNSTVQLVVKRRVLLQPEVQAFRVSLSRTGGAGRKSDFGLNLSTKLYIKDLQVKTSSLQEGDVIIRINNTPCEGMTLKEAKKLIENTKDKLQLVVKREAVSGGSGAERPQQPLYSSQNLYVQPPRRASEVLLPQRGDLNPIPPPRPPPPLDESLPSDYYNPHPPQTSRPRLISFVKQGPLGIRLAGGNAVGIFVTAVQPGSQALVHGLSQGDKILSVNNKDLVNFTREEAVNLLMSLNDEVKLLVHHNVVEYDNVLGKALGDFFYIKTHFTYEKKGELGFKVGDIFQVTDTLVNGSLGYWGVVRYSNGEKGVVPNMVKATEVSGGPKASDGTRSFFRKKKEVAKFEPYERVVLKHPGFMRPVVILGSVGDIARERLTLEHPDVFSSPAQDSHSSKLIKMSSIREIMNRGQHAVLDVSPSVVEKLNSAQLYPIVVLVKVDKKSLKEIRGLKSGHGTLLGRKSPRKLLSVSSKLESTWFHIITMVLTVSSDDNWLRKVKEGVDKEQGRSIWVAEEGKPSSSDDCVFPLQPSTRNSYASSPESDGEAEKDHVNGGKNGGIELPNYNEPPAYSIASQAYDKEMYPMLPMSSAQQKILLDKSMHLDHSPPDSPAPPCPPPMVDRTCKPKSATERLFGDYGSRDTLERSTNGHGGHRKGSSSNGGTPNYDARTYDQHHDVYRFTRSTAQPLGRDSKGSYSPYRTLEEGSNGSGSQQLYNNYKKDFQGPPQDQYNYKDIQELKHYSSHGNGSGSPFTSRGNANASPFKGPHDMYTKGPPDMYQKGGEALYNNGTRSPSYRTHYSPYRALDPNGNPYEESSSPYKPPPPPKVKPVPPPKPVKPARTDLNGASNGNGVGSSNGFYLNVPLQMGSRGISAFEPYGKDNRRSDETESCCKWILPDAGGALECCGVKVIIPPGALEYPQEICIQVYENTYASAGEGSGSKVLSPLVKLSPEGLKFRIPVDLILPPNFLPVSNRRTSLCSNGPSRDAEGPLRAPFNSSSQFIQEDSSIRLSLDRF